MRLKIELLSQNPITLPRGYNEYLHALIYKHLNTDDAKWLHDDGFAFEKRRFKLFTFSSIITKGTFDRTKKEFTFPRNVHFYVSSPVDWILEQLAGNLLKSESVTLGNNSLMVSSVEIFRTAKIEKESIRVKAISPIEVHSTFTLENGKKKTHYYTPYEDEFSSFINENLKKKYNAFYKKECYYNIITYPQFSGNNNEKIIYFGAGSNKTLIKGWQGYYKLNGDPQFLQFAIDAGLGSRSSQGFGLIELA